MLQERWCDIKDDEIFGGFYDYELQKVKNNVMYRIEKILKSRTRKGKRPFDFDTWIAAEDVHDA